MLVPIVLHAKIEVGRVRTPRCKTMSRTGFEPPTTCLLVRTLTIALSISGDVFKKDILVES